MLLLLFNPLLSASSGATLENQERAVGRETFGMRVAAVVGRCFLVNAQDFQNRILFYKTKYRLHILNECSQIPNEIFWPVCSIFG